MSQKSAIEQLVDEYVAWLDQNDLPQLSADEHDPHALTQEQREWISDFIERWDAASDADAEFFDKQPVVQP